MRSSFTLACGVERTGPTGCSLRIPSHKVEYGWPSSSRCHLAQCGVRRLCCFLDTCPRQRAGEYHISVTWRFVGAKVCLSRLRRSRCLHGVHGTCRALDFDGVSAEPSSKKFLSFSTAVKSIFLLDQFQIQPKSRFARAASKAFKFASVSAIFGFPKRSWISGKRDFRKVAFSSSISDLPISPVSNCRTTSIEYHERVRLRPVARKSRKSCSRSLMNRSSSASFDKTM